MKVMAPLPLARGSLIPILRARFRWKLNSSRMKIVSAAEAADGARVTLVLDHVGEQTAGAVCAKMRALAARCQALTDTFEFAKAQGIARTN